MSHDENKAGQSEQAYADDSPLTRVFGGNARVKIIATMLSERDRDLNVSNIARLAGIARSTVYDHLEALEEMGVIVQTRKIGTAPLYQINNDSEMVEYIHRIEGLALKQLLSGGSEEVAE